MGCTLCAECQYEILAGCFFIVYFESAFLHCHFSVSCDTVTQNSNQPASCQGSLAAALVDTVMWVMRNVSTGNQQYYYNSIMNWCFQRGFSLQTDSCDTFPSMLPHKASGHLYPKLTAATAKTTSKHSNEKMNEWKIQSNKYNKEILSIDCKLVKWKN